LQSPLKSGVHPLDREAKVATIASGFYGFADASNFKGVKGYESYANREAAATAVLASAVTGNKSATESKPKMPPDIIRRTRSVRKLELAVDSCIS
jgi:hypothetical protein